MTSHNSPDLLRRPDPRAAGVRRLNRVPLMVALLILALIAAAVFYTYWQRLELARNEQEHRDTPIAALQNAPDGEIPHAVKDIPVISQPIEPPPLPVVAEKVNPWQREWEEYMKRNSQMRQAREQQNIAALDAPSGVQVNLQKPASAPAAAGPAPGAQSTATEAFTRYAMDRLGRLDQQDLNRQDEKIAFIADRAAKTEEENTLASRRMRVRSAFELRAGAVIPAVMIGGLNSDMPGQLLAQVANNVYDTATGTRIVIPQGSKLVGTYDSNVTTGQERVLVAWTRIIFPDASAIDIGRMPGADESGNAGMHDQVNNHFWKVWSNALMLSAFSAGIQLSQGGNNNSGQSLNATQTVAASTGQQMGQLGMEIARRNLQIQPTLEIRPGYRFLVQVTKDMLLRRWAPKDQPTAFISGYPYRENVQQR